MDNLNGLRMNPKYPYTETQLSIRKWEAQIWLKVAEDRGKLDHPAAAIMRENLTLIESMRNAGAA